MVRLEDMVRDSIRPGVRAGQSRQGGDCHLAGYLAASVDEIDYLNFKDRVAKRLGKRRHDVLLSVWATLHGLEEGGV